MNAIKLLGVLLGSMVFASGCKDKAEPDYAKCLQADAAKQVEDAWAACNAAVSADPTSKSGTAAATKLGAMKPAYDTWKAADDAKKAKEVEVQQQTARDARDAHVASLRARVHRKYWDDEPDSDCTGKGLPPFKYDYAGGTFAEDRELAVADGCGVPFSAAEINTYCCPQRPRTF